MMTFVSLRIKLNDKFKVAADVRDSVVVVEHKYNSVCEYCGHEIAVPSEEELIKKYTYWYWSLF